MYDLIDKGLDFNPIIVLFLTLIVNNEGSLSEKLFQSYYSLISNDNLKKFITSDKKFQSYYSLISNT